MYRAGVQQEEKVHFFYTPHPFIDLMEKEAESRKLLDMQWYVSF